MIIGIYLHELTNNERENSILQEAGECGIENFEFIVGERVSAGKVPIIPSALTFCYSN